MRHNGRLDALITGFNSLGLAIPAFWLGLMLILLFAVTLLMAGRARDAITPLEQALAAQPRHGVALENLGLAYLMLGNFAEAQHALTRERERADWQKRGGAHPADHCSPSR